tara:strand:+ start:15467 stop:16525 length:1059 start_codon:yes stop_codon:yes gene_type:complete
MIEILKLDKESDREAYTAILKTLNLKDPYNSLEFINSFSDGFSNLVCLKVTQDSHIVLLPGYSNEIEGTEKKDFLSPYGYSGLIYCPSTPGGIVDAAWIEIKEYLDQHFVSTFIRFSLDTDYSFFKEGVKPIMKNIRGVIIDYDTQWSNFENKVRKNVRRAKRENLRAEIIDGSDLSIKQLRVFYDIYVDTMKRNNAEDKYYFSFEQFSSFSSSRGELCAFCFIYDENKVVSVEMVLKSEDSIFSFLGGTLSEAFSKRPNDFLKYELINWARNEGLKYFVLGGGYGAEDGIYNYKKSFFPNDVVDYCVGKFIHNENDYKTLSEKAKENFIANNDKSEEDFYCLNFFPLYRAT